jgi:hypothetical protein
MSLNVENLFVKSPDQARVTHVVESYWADSTPEPQPDWGLPSSYEPLLAREQKRKIAISPPRDGWIALIESKGVIDFALANVLSKGLDTIVIAVQLSEVTGAAGYAVASRGEVMESLYDEQHQDPLGCIRQSLRRYKVPFGLTLFRAAVQKLSEGWIVKFKK